MSSEPLPRDEVAASVSAMRDLGSDYDDAVADALAVRLEQTIDARVEARLQDERAAPAHRGEDDFIGHRLVLAITSLVLAVPLTALTASMVDPGAVVVLWIAITVINVAFILGTRRRDR